MFISELAEPQLLVIYPGRFQPFHKGHHAVFDYLTSKFGRSNVFIATSNKVEPPKSPFSFAEKSYFMQLTGVPADRIIQATQPYKIEDVIAGGNLQITHPENTVVIFAVSQKDMDEDPRFAFRPKKDGSLSYFQPLKDIRDTKSMKEHAYIMVVPTFDFNVAGDPMQSGTELRVEYSRADPKKKQAIIQDLFGRYTHEAEQIMSSKIQTVAEEEKPLGFVMPQDKPKDDDGYFRMLAYKFNKHPGNLTKREQRELQDYLLTRKAKLKESATDDDIWGPQGRFAGDTKVDIGGVSMKEIKVGDTVKYFGEKAQVVALNTANDRARITTANGKTLNVRLSDLRQLGRGIAVGSLNEFAPGAGRDSGDYFRTLASAWYNGTFDSGSLQKGIKSQEDVERLLQRGIVCPDGKTRKLNIDYNSNFDGVVIFSDDYYEHGDLDGNDGRTGRPWGPYDYMEFKDEELDEGVAEGLNEFAPAGGGGNIPRGPKTPRRGPWGDNGEDPYQLRRYNRSVDFFDQFDSDGVDKQNFDKATGEYEGYYFDRDAASGITQIAYFKFDDPTKIGDNDPGIGWYYEPIDEGVAEGSLNESSSDEAWELVGQPVPEIQQFVKQMGYGNDEQSVAKITSIIDRVSVTQMPAASIPKLKNLANKGNDAQTLKSILQISGRPDAEQQYTKLMQARDAGEGRNRDVSGYIQYVKSGNYDPPVLLKLPTGVYVIGGRTRLYAALALGVPANVKIISANSFKQGVAEEAGVGLVKGGNDPRYLMATVGDQNDVNSDTLGRSLKKYFPTRPPKSGQRPVSRHIGKGR